MLARAEALTANSSARPTPMAACTCRCASHRAQYRPCVVGNMGSDFRFNYSVLGDTVNVLATGIAHQGLSSLHGDRLAHRGKAKEKFARWRSTSSW